MYNNILATLDCFSCCKKFTSKSSTHRNEINQNSSLIGKKYSTSSEQGRTPYYTVRRVSRVAGTISLEDLNDGHGSDSNLNKPQQKPKILLGSNGKDINDSGLWECPSESSLVDGNKSMEILSTTPPAKQHKRWQKSLQNQLRQRLNKSSSPLAASTPDLSTLTKSDVTYSAKSSANTSPKLGVMNDIRRAGSLDVVNGSAWMKSQSMLDVANESGGSSNSARDFGLDPSLYPAPERASAAPPNPEQARATLRGREDRFVEMSHGVVFFTAEYFSGKLHVHVSHIKNLPPKNEIRKYQVVVKLAILPHDKGHHLKVSKIPRESNSAKFDEDFEFSLESAAGHTLRISACDTSVHGKYDAVGHALLDLEEVMLLSEPKHFQLNLYKQSEPNNGNAGLLQTTLSFDHREQKVCLLALQCRGLQVAQGTRGSTRAPDKYTTYIKATLYHKGQKVKSKKSPVINNEKDPFHNHEFQYHMGAENLSECCLVVSVLLKSHSRLLKSDILIGRIIFGPNFYADRDNMTPWGRVVLGQKTASHWYKLYI